MRIESFLTLTAMLEPAVFLATAALVVILAADALLTERHERPGPSLDAAIAPRTERRLLALLLLLATSVRIVGWQSALTPAWFFSEVSVLPVDKLLHDGTLWTTWLRQVASTRVDVAHQATFVLPVLAGLEIVFGPRFGLPVLAGALWGGLAVVLAWALGRQMRSQTFGLVLAAIVAFSPLQLMWSRVSALCTEAVAHVLLALVVGYVAGRRGSILLALLTGLLAWTSFQQYYAARVSLPLALVAIVAGAQRAWRLPRGVALVLVATLGFGAVHVAIHATSALRESLWPSYGGYVGNRGEQTLTQLVTQNVENVRHEAQKALSYYFVMRRTGWSSDGHNPGIANGGLCSAAVALLGIVGAIAASRRLRRQWPWFAVAALGIALPALSAPSARRMLVFDLAWCAFAAHGLLAVVDGVGRRFAYRLRAWATVGIATMLALWSTAAVFGLSAAMSDGSGVHIPFGESGFGDGIACRRCLDAAKGWQRDIAEGAFVVLFDNDAFRENRTSPGGLRAYGKIASLAATGSIDRFVDGYALMANFDGEYPTVGRMFDATRTDFAAELAARVARAAPRRVVWHFERATPWERWLAARLRDAGGELETFPTPLAPRGGIRVVTPYDRWAQAASVIDELAVGLRESPTPRFDLIERDRLPFDGPVFQLSAADAGMSGPPEWIISSWSTLRFRSHAPEVVFPIGARLVRGPAEHERLEFLTQFGSVTNVELPSLRQQTVAAPIAAKTFASNCGAYADGHWWVVEAYTGGIVSTHPAAKDIPEGPWIGIAAGPGDELVLASADQAILVFDPAHGTVVARFPARVAPTVRNAPDECTALAVGSDWVGIANPRTTALSMYSLDGVDLGARRLDRLGDLVNGVQAIGGAGRYFGLAGDRGVRTFEVRQDRECSDAPPASQ